MLLLRGCVVVATHDSDGDLGRLSWQQLDLLAAKSRSLTKRDERALNRRMGRDRPPRRDAAPVKAAPVRHAKTAALVKV